MDEEGKPKEKYSVLEGTDWYSYCSNNPVRFVDLLGLDDEKPGEESSVNQLGTEPRQTVPDEVIAKYIDKGWAFIGDSMEKHQQCPISNTLMLMVIVILILFSKYSF